METNILETLLWYLAAITVAISSFLFGTWAMRDAQAEKTFQEMRKKARGEVATLSSKKRTENKLPSFNRK